MYVCMYESTIPMLSTLAVSLAMSTWSPVIIFTATPYLFASSIVCEVHTYIHHTYIHTYVHIQYLLGVRSGRVQEGQQPQELPALHIAGHRLRHGQGPDAAQT